MNEKRKHECLCDKNYHGKTCGYSRCKGRGDFIKGSFCKCETNYGGQNCELRLADEACQNQGVKFTNNHGKL